jgi:hypothetical protein
VCAQLQSLQAIVLKDEVGIRNSRYSWKRVKAKVHLLYFIPCAPSISLTSELFSSAHLFDRLSSETSIETTSSFHEVMKSTEQERKKNGRKRWSLETRVHIISSVHIFIVSCILDLFRL